MANTNIYNVVWSRLLLWLLPAPLRKTIALIWLQKISMPLQQVHSKLLLFRDNTLYWLGINSQVCYLEKMLNDRYDPTLRRIYIAKPQTFGPWYLFKAAELKPKYLFKTVEALPVYLYTKGETGAGGVDFIVVVPITLTANFTEMNVLIEKHKLPDKEHAIRKI